MCKWLVFLLAGGALQAAIIKGSVVENQTGKPLARTLISIQPLPGSAGPTATVRTNTYGMFEFIDLPAGAYLIHAARRGFMPAQYGQKNWRAAGQPVVVEQDQSVFLGIRLPRFSAISGIIVDENDVGLPEHEVVAMSNARPPRVMAKAQADDRGMYRIAGLDPGAYLVRTLARAYEDGGYLPTFYRETARVDEAGTVETLLDQETTNVKVRPFPGKLFTISGTIMTIPQGNAAMVTLVSDVGRETITTSGAFQFVSKPPGPYEILVEQLPDRRVGPMGAFVPLALERDTTGMRIAVLPMAGIGFDFQSPQSGRLTDTSGIKVQHRRVDLAGEGPVETLRLTNGAASLLQGRWQLMLTPSAAYVAIDFRGCRGERPEGRADGWNEITVDRNCGVRFLVSDKPGGVHGMATMGAHEPAGGVPVFLEAYDETTRKRVVDLRSTRTDMRGQYSFSGLAPGTYRLVSTFEYQTPLSADIDAMSPRVFRIEEGRDQQQDLDVYVIR